MPQLRVGLAQIDTTVGDLQGNSDLVSQWVAHARKSGCHAVVFPEMT
ncbi:MAG: synthetase, partial [Frankiales bacterium]|nr:synthetase [Frankiales bacterium]